MKKNDQLSVGRKLQRGRLLRSLYCVIACAAMLSIECSTHAQTVNDNLTAQQMAQAWVGSVGTVQNAVFTGVQVAGGSFSGGLPAGLGIDHGIVLDTGDLTQMTRFSQGTDNGAAGDSARTRKSLVNSISNQEQSTRILPRLTKNLASITAAKPAGNTLDSKPKEAIHKYTIPLVA